MPWNALPVSLENTIMSYAIYVDTTITLEAILLKCWTKLHNIVYTVLVSCATENSKSNIEKDEKVHQEMRRLEVGSLK